MSLWLYKGWLSACWSQRDPILDFDLSNVDRRVGLLSPCSVVLISRFLRVATSSCMKSLSRSTWMAVMCDSGSDWVLCAYERSAPAADMADAESSQPKPRKSRTCKWAHRFFFATSSSKFQEGRRWILILVWSIPGRTEPSGAMISEGWRRAISLSIDSVLLCFIFNCPAAMDSHATPQLSSFL